MEALRSPTPTPLTPTDTSSPSNSDTKDQYSAVPHNNTTHDDDGDNDVHTHHHQTQQHHHHCQQQGQGQKHTHARRQHIQVLWSGLLHDLLGRGLVELRLGAGGTAVVCWAHRRAREVACSRYLGSRGDGGDVKQGEEEEKEGGGGVPVRTWVFSKLADYFSGKLAENTVESSGGTTVSTQPLVLLSEGEDPPSPHPHPRPPPPPLFLYNVRKLQLLPGCLAKSGRMGELKELLLDLYWLKARILTSSCSDAINDFSYIKAAVPLGRQGSDSTEHDLSLLRKALAFSVQALNSSSSEDVPTTLCQQLLGRLLPHITSNTTEARTLLRDSLAKALQDLPPSSSSSSSLPMLLTPLQPLYHIPGDPFLLSMEGHRDLVSGITAVNTTTTFVDSQDAGEGERTGLMMLTCSWDKSLKSWDLQTSGVLKTFDGHTDKVLSVAVTADTQYAVSGSSDKTLRHWYVPTGECLHTMEGHTSAVNAVAITRDGSKAVSGSSDRTVKVWNTDPSSSMSGNLIFTMRRHSAVLCLSLMPDDRHLALGTAGGALGTCDIVSGEEGTVSPRAHRGAVTSVATIMEGEKRQVLSGSSLGGVRLWDAGSGECVWTLAGEHEDSSEDPGLVPVPVTGMGTGSNGNVAITANTRATTVWDLQTGTRLWELDGVFTSACMADEGRLAITGSKDTNNTIRIWDLKSRPTRQATQFFPGAGVTSVAHSPCGRYSIIAGSSPKVVVCDAESLEAVRQIELDTSTATDGVTARPGGARGVRGAGGDGGNEGACVCVRQVEVMRDCCRIAMACTDGMVYLWNGETGERLCVMSRHQGPVNCLAVSGDSELLMSGGEDTKVAFWSIRTGKKLREFDNHTSAVVAVRFAQQQSSGAHHVMITAERNGTVCVRDFKTASILSNKSTHRGDLLSLCISPDTRFFLTTSSDKTAHVLGLPNGEIIAVLSGHREAVTCGSVFPDSKHCLTGSLDHTLKVWSLQEEPASCSCVCVASLYTDAPLLSCAVNRKALIVYGTSIGWVSSACYNKEGKNPLIARLTKAAVEGTASDSHPSGLDSVSAQGSSITSHASSASGSTTPNEIPAGDLVSTSRYPLLPAEREEIGVDVDGSCSEEQVHHSSDTHQNDAAAVSSSGMLVHRTASGVSCGSDAEPSVERDKEERDLPLTREGINKQLGGSRKGKDRSEGETKEPKENLEESTKHPYEESAGQPATSNDRDNNKHTSSTSSTCTIL